MTEILSKQTSSEFLAQEENLLDWNEVIKNFKTTQDLIKDNNT